MASVRKIQFPVPLNTLPQRPAEFLLEMPKGGKVVSVAPDPTGRLSVFVLVEGLRTPELENRSFFIVTDGMSTPAKGKYVGGWLQEIGLRAWLFLFEAEVAK